MSRRTHRYPIMNRTDGRTIAVVGVAGIALMGILGTLYSLDIAPKAFGLDDEYTVPAFYSGILLALAAWMVFRLGQPERGLNAAGCCSVLGALFLAFLAADEAFSLHKRIDVPHRRRLAAPLRAAARYLAISGSPACSAHHGPTVAVSRRPAWCRSRGGHEAVARVRARRLRQSLIADPTTTPRARRHPPYQPGSAPRCPSRRSCSRWADSLLFARRVSANRLASRREAARR